jgi:hypothetical protein
MIVAYKKDLKSDFVAKAFFILMYGDISRFKELDDENDAIEQHSQKNFEKKF